jgi:hypothetical protein
MRGVTRYSFTAAPLAAALCHDTVARPVPATAAGVPIGTGAPIVAGAERAENLLHPAEFFAATLNVSVWPFFRPTMVCVVALDWNW